MVRFFLFFSFLAAAIAGRGQEFALQSDKMNVVYIGLPNPIIVMGQGRECTDITVKVTRGRLVGSGCRYTYYIDSGAIGKETISILAGTGAKEKQIGAMEVRVKRVPDVALTIGGRYPGPITRQELLSANGPVVSADNFDYDIHWTITACTLSIGSGADSAIVFERSYTDANGVAFGPAAERFFNRLTHNDFVLIEDIRCLRSDGKEEKIPDVFYRIAY